MNDVFVEFICFYTYVEIIGHFSLPSSPAHHSPMILSLALYHVRQTAPQNKPQKKANPF
jgi:hypothetical protein